MSISKIVYFVVLLPLSLAAFENQWNKSDGHTISRFKVCGERCSGTNYLKHLILENFPDLSHTKSFEYGHKHFLWWFEMPVDRGKLKRLKYHPDAVNLNGSEDCLFIVIVRDPYDWIRSFYLNPFEAAEHIKRANFETFVSIEWQAQTIYGFQYGQYNEIDNHNPWTGKPFKNVLELRKYKTLNYLTLALLVQNYVLVRYEDVRDDPEGFIEYLASRYHLTPKTFTPITTYKGSTTPYTPKQYFPIDQHILKFINSELDWELEGILGYEKFSSRV